MKNFAEEDLEKIPIKSEYWEAHDDFEAYRDYDQFSKIINELPVLSFPLINL